MGAEAQVGQITLEGGMVTQYETPSGRGRRYIRLERRARRSGRLISIVLQSTRPRGRG